MPLPHVKTAYARGAFDALARFGLKQAGEELRLKIPTRTFHGFEAVHRTLGKANAKKANEANADMLANTLNEVEAPDGPSSLTLQRDPLERSPAWGPPSNPAGGAANQLSDMGLPSSAGAV